MVKLKTIFYLALTLSSYVLGIGYVGKNAYCSRQELPEVVVQHRTPLVYPAGEDRLAIRITNRGCSYRAQIGLPYLLIRRCPVQKDLPAPAGASTSNFHPLEAQMVCLQNYSLDCDNTINTLRETSNIEKFFQDWEKQRNRVFKYVQKPQSFLNKKPEYAVVNAPRLEALHRDFLSKLDRLPITYFADRQEPLSKAERIGYFRDYCQKGYNCLSSDQLGQIINIFETSYNQLLKADYDEFCRRRR